MGGAPRAPHFPAFKRAEEVEKVRRRRNDVKTSPLNTGQLALSYMRCVAAGAISGAWGHFGGFGALFANRAHFMGLRIVGNMGTVPRFERAQSSERGNLRLAKDEPSKINRDRLRQRGSDQSIEFSGRKQAQLGRSSNYRSGRFRRQERYPSRKRYDSSARDSKHDR